MYVWAITVDFRSVVSIRIINVLLFLDSCWYTMRSLKVAAIAPGRRVQGPRFALRKSKLNRNSPQTTSQPYKVAGESKCDKRQLSGGILDSKCSTLAIHFKNESVSDTAT